jgi:hypothetical protein
MSGLQVLKPNGKDYKATFRMPSDMFWDLKQLAVDKRTNVTELVIEALSDLLIKYGKRAAAGGGGERKPSKKEHTVTTTKE